MVAVHLFNGCDFLFMLVVHLLWRRIFYVRVSSFMVVAHLYMDVVHLLWWWFNFFPGIGSSFFVCGSSFMVLVHPFMDVVHLLWCWFIFLWH